jgi:hypothetical protein
MSPFKLCLNTETYPLLRSSSLKVANTTSIGHFSFLLLLGS